MWPSVVLQWVACCASFFGGLPVKNQRNWPPLKALFWVMAASGKLQKLINYDELFGCEIDQIWRGGCFYSSLFFQVKKKEEVSFALQDGRSTLEIRGVRRQCRKPRVVGNSYLGSEFDCFKLWQSCLCACCCTSPTKPPLPPNASGMASTDV